MKRFVGPTNPERLWRRVIKTDSCWLWQGPLSADGYGSIKWDGRLTKVHHVAALLDGRPRPDGMEMDHLCRVRHCVRPSHLVWTTHTKNVQRIPTELLGTANRTKTSCKYEHEFTDENTRIYTRRDGSQTRVCLACQKRKAKVLWEKRKAASLAGAL